MKKNEVKFFWMEEAKRVEDAVIYFYDGTFEGLLCCVFESYAQKEIPAQICAPDVRQISLLAVREICTEPEKARRVLRSIPEKIGPEALDFVRQAFLTCFREKELYILLFLRKGYRCGPRVMRLLTDETVHALTKAVRHLYNESHLLKGFIRFSECNGVLVAQIGPKNFVLPLLAAHFSGRYPEERFIIIDQTHHMALAYQPHHFAILPAAAVELPAPDAQEAAFRKLWQIFYDTIEIKERHNPKCRMNLMPKRYWRYMTEFAAAEEAVERVAAERFSQLT